MLSAGGLTSGLASLSAWLDAPNGTGFDALFGAWARASGFRAAGVLWPAAAPTFARFASGGTVVISDSAPAERGQVLAILSDNGPQTTVWQMPQSAGRLYALLLPAGRDPGLLYAERPAGPWTEADRHYLTLSAGLIARSQALAADLGPVVDPVRLDQRLADAAVIAGRMAHDFDNILTGIIGFADLTAPLVPAGSQAAKFVAEIAKVGHRGIVFTQQLHQLSRSASTKPSPGGIAAAFAKESAKFSASAEVRADLPAGLPAVAMEPGPLSAVLGHLLANAVEATPAVGGVSVSARVVDLSAADAAGYLGAVSPGPHVEVTVIDSGPGIKPDTRARLFADPFVTTKVRHRGLGLAIVYRTLAAHRGGVRIGPADPGPGTAARFVVPPAAARPPVTSPSTVSASPLRQPG